MTDKEKLILACTRLAQSWELLRGLKLYHESDAIRKLGSELLGIEMVTEKTKTGDLRHLWQIKFPYDFRPECTFRFSFEEPIGEIVGGTVNTQR